MNEIIVRHMLADKIKMKNAIMGFSKEFQEFNIISCEIIPDKSNSSLLKTKIISKDKEKARKFLTSKVFKTHLHTNLKNRFEIILENNPLSFK